MLEDSMRLDDRPVAIRWSRGPAAHVGHGEVGAGLSSRRVRQGDGSVALVGFGQLFPAARDAVELLAADGIDCTLYDPRVVQPLDPEMIADLATHDLVVTAEDGLRIGGAGAGVRDALADADADSRVRVLGIPTEYIPHDHPDAIHARFGLDAEGIADHVRSLRR